MKYPKSSFVLGLLCAVAVLFALSSTAEARIGERKESIERRLFASGGIMYRDDAVEASRRKGMPYLKYIELIDASVDIRVYYKTADGRRPSSKELKKNVYCLAGICTCYTSMVSLQSKCISVVRG